MSKTTDQPQQDTVLRTDRLILRGARQTDLRDLFEVFGHPDAMRYWSSAADTSPEQTQDRLDRMMTSAAAGPLAYFVLERDGKVIGTAGGHHSSEVGFILHPAYWRQGYISEAMGAIIPYLWEVLDVPALTADVDPLNLASVGLLTSLGFRVTGFAKDTYCINGLSSDSVYMALPRPNGSDAAG